MYQTVGVAVRSPTVKLHTIEAIEGFAQQWLEAQDKVIVDWAMWNKRAMEFFCVTKTPHDEVMHNVMALLVVICHGSVLDVKECFRCASPSALQVAYDLLRHLPQCAPVFEAELRYRAGELAVDWTLQNEGDGCVVVRSEYRVRKQEVTH